MESKPKNKTHAWIACILFALLYLAIPVVLVFIVPVYAERWADIGAELPKPSQILVDASNFLKFNLFFIWPVVLAPLALAVWLVEGKVGRKAIPILWAMFVGALFLWWVIYMAIQLPTMEHGIHVVE